MWKTYASYGASSYREKALPEDRTQYRTADFVKWYDTLAADTKNGRIGSGVNG